MRASKFFWFFMIVMAISFMSFGVVLASEDTKKEDIKTEDVKKEDSKTKDEEKEDIKKSGTICNGVFIEGIDMGGKSSTEAEELITEHINTMKSKKVTIMANDKSIDTTMGELGYDAVANDYITEVLNIGTVGNVIQRYKDLKDVENGKKEYDIEFAYDESLIDKFVNDNIDKCNVKAKEPSMTPKSNGRVSEGNISSAFTYTEGVTGVEVDKEDAITLIKEKLKEWDGEDVVVEPKTVIDEPEYTIEQLKSMDAKLGSYTTSYSASQKNRCKNVANAASKINGTVVYPGETFSILKKITPVTSANGYYEAGSYMAGKVVESVGGGICQVSTTLYNAVLLSELEIVKRSNHSMTVAYVDIAFDAMISSTSGSDFKFKNNTKYPVYIEAYTSSSSITFNIYGKETRASNRSIKFVNEILETYEPGNDVVTVDSSKSSSYQKVTQSAHTGYKAKLYKIVMVDGVEKEKININTSTYKSSPKYVTVGSSSTPVKPDATADPNSEISQDDVPMEPAVEVPTETPTQVPTEIPTEVPAETTDVAVE